MTKIALNDLKPNPFRDLTRLPAKPEKVAALMESIKETDFWDNIVCRKAPNGSGGYEIAYGHNRLAALRKLRWTEVDIPVRDLDNDTMAKIMARENHEEWGAYAEVDAETVRSVVFAVGDGRITFPRTVRLVGQVKIRFAPSFTTTSATNAAMAASDKSYTVQSLANFLGWNEAKTEDVLQLLSFQEAEQGKKLNFSGLTSTQAIKIIRETRRVVRETEDEKLASSIGNQLANEFRSSNSSVKTQKDSTDRLISTNTVMARTNELMRGVRVKRHIAKRKLAEIKISLQKEDRQVAIFLDACKAWEKALQSASVATEKFSPEAKKFTLRRLGIISQVEALLRGKLK